MRRMLPRLVLAATLGAIPTMGVAQVKTTEADKVPQISTESKLYGLQFSGGTLPELIDVLNESVPDVNFMLFGDVKASTPASPLRIPAIRLYKVTIDQIIQVLATNEISSATGTLNVKVESGDVDGARPIVQFVVVPIETRPVVRQTRIRQLATVVPATAKPEEQKQRLADVMQLIEVALAASGPDMPKAEIQVHFATRMMIATGSPEQQSILDEALRALSEAEATDHTVRQVAALEAVERDHAAGAADGVRKDAMIEDLKMRLNAARSESARDRDEVKRYTDELMSAELRLARLEADAKVRAEARAVNQARIGNLEEQLLTADRNASLAASKYGADHYESRAARQLVDALKAQIDTFRVGNPTTQP